MRFRDEVKLGFTEKKSKIWDDRENHLNSLIKMYKRAKSEWIKSYDKRGLANYANISASNITIYMKRVMNDITNDHPLETHSFKRAHQDQTEKDKNGKSFVSINAMADKNVNSDRLGQKMIQVWTNIGVYHHIVTLTTYLEAGMDNRKIFMNWMKEGDSCQKNAMSSELIDAKNVNRGFSYVANDDSPKTKQKVYSQGIMNAGTMSRGGMSDSVMDNTIKEIKNKRSEFLSLIMKLNADLITFLSSKNTYNEIWWTAWNF